MAAEGRRLGAITLDQAVAGGSNVLVGVLAAHLLAPDLFGLFSLVLLVYGLAQIGFRALVGEPLLVHPAHAAEASGEVVGTGALVGLALGGLVALAAVPAYAWDPRLAHGLLVLAVAMPLLALQDLGRYLGLATHRPGFALGLDSAWLVLLVLGFGALLLLDARTLPWLVAAWAGAGALAALGLLATGGPLGPRGPASQRPRPRVGAAWLRSTWSMSWRYLLTAAAGHGSVILACLVLGLVSGRLALAALVGAQLAVRPVTMLQIAAQAAGTTEVARAHDDPELVERHVRRTTLVTTAVAVLNGLVLALLPDPLGRLLLGDTWEVAEPVLLAVSVQVVVLSLVTGPRAGLLGMRRVDRTVPVTLADAALLVPLAAVGAHLGGAEGTIWAVVVGQTAVASVWWAVYRRELARSSRRTTTT